MLKNLWNTFVNSFNDEYKTEFKSQKEINEYYSVYKFYG